MDMPMWKAQSMTTDTPMSVQSIPNRLQPGECGLRKGLIDLDAPVSQYLKASISTVGLSYGEDYHTSALSHTSGMPLGDFNLIYAP